MYTVANRVLVKKGMGHKMAPAFTSRKELTEFDGFQKVEMVVSIQNEEHDELNVVMYSNTLEKFRHLLKIRIPPAARVSLLSFLKSSPQ